MVLRAPSDLNGCPQRNAQRAVFPSVGETVGAPYSGRMEWIWPLLGSVVAGAVGGGVVTGAFGLYQMRREKTSERGRWLRDLKIESYAKFPRASDEFNTGIQRLNPCDNTIEKLHEIGHETQPHIIRLIAPEHVVEAANKMNNQLGVYMKTRANHIQLDASARSIDRTDREAPDLYRKLRESFVSVCRIDLET